MLDRKIDVDTAEDEPPKVSRKEASKQPLPCSLDLRKGREDPLLGAGSELNRRRVRRRSAAAGGAREED